MTSKSSSIEPNEGFTPGSSFVRWAGFAIAGGGILEAAINLILTPLMSPGAPLEQTAVSSVFLWRQSLSAAAVMLLLFGSVGLYLLQQRRGGLGGAVAFAMAFTGSALVLAWEWIDIVVLRELAFKAPRALRALEDAKGFNLYNLGALIPITLFTLGWLALAAWSWRVTPALRTPALLVILGIFSIPLFSAVLGPRWGGAAGNLVLGSGLFRVGMTLRRLASFLA
jgi:hypothetical protein